MAKVAPNGGKTRLHRDTHGRVTAVTYPDGTQEARTYDAHGWLTSITDARGGVTQFGYDAFGRHTSIEDALGGVTRLGYDAGAGGFAEPSSLTRPDDVTLRRGFDADGNLSSISDGEGRTTHYGYGAFECCNPSAEEIALAILTASYLLHNAGSDKLVTLKKVQLVSQPKVALYQISKHHLYPDRRERITGEIF